MQKNLVSESDPLAGRAAVVRTRPATFEKVAAQRSCHEEMDALYAACPGGIAAPLLAGMRLLTAVSCEDARSPTLQQDSCKPEFPQAADERGLGQLHVLQFVLP